MVVHLCGQRFRFFKFHTTRIVTGKQAKPKCLFMCDSVVDTWVDVWVFFMR